MYLPIGQQYVNGIKCNRNFKWPSSMQRNDQN